MTVETKKLLSFFATALFVFAAAVLLGRVTVGCNPQPVPVAPDVYVVVVTADAAIDSPSLFAVSDADVNSDESDDAAALDDCASACRVYRRFACPEGSRARGFDGSLGATCTLFCRDTQAQGHYNLHPECVAKKSTVAGIRDCGARCLGR